MRACSIVDGNKDLMMMSVKNHQMAPTIRVDAAFGFSPDPCYRHTYLYILDLYNIMNCLWTVYLSQKSSGYEPKTVVDAELVLHHVVLNNTEEQNPMFHFDKIQFLLKKHIHIVDVNNTEEKILKWFWWNEIRQHSPHQGWGLFHS